MINIQKRYSQSDWRWYFHRVGGYSNFHNIGCTTTAVTMLLETFGYNLTPPQVEEALTKVRGYTSGLIIWSRIQIAFPKVKFNYRYYSYDNTKVKNLINKNIPVLVEVRIGKGKHWVLFIGDQKAVDPLNGNYISTSKYTPIGFAEIIGSK